MTARIIVAVLRRGVQFSALGVVVGALAGWVGYLGAGHRGERIGADAAPWYWLFAVACPALVVAASRSTNPIDDPGIRRRAAVLVLATGVVAGIVGTVGYLVLAILVPSSVGIAHVNATDVRHGLLVHFPLPGLAVLALLVMVAPLIVDRLRPRSAVRD